MANSQPDTSSNQPDSGGAEDAEARMFYERLELNGQLVEVQPGTDTSKLPARVTHVRWPDGRVERIRFA